MGYVIKIAFNRERKPRTDLPVGHKCQILLLPCIRYERYAEPPAKPKAAAKKVRKRRAPSR